ncbi:hypothetical protein [Maritalea porphyrae]|uniref:hypothetical protein n=1 Tax=Maritalea porphyrae TaxID=880732 RepID=UPI0022AEFC18|nr:hypothetical protein [Maritalea porphyrae]MCZ4274004.1 hypothetical protein [Maritalea porphyrae]
MSKEQIEIQELVRWALVDQCVEQAAAAVRRGDGPTANLTSTAKIERMLMLGCTIDGHGPNDQNIIANCHVDAIEVFDALWHLKGQARDLVYFHAKKDSQPDWIEEGVGTLVPQVGKNGKPVKMFEGAKTGDCVVRSGYLYTYDGYPPHIVNAARAAHTVWWEGLNALQCDLKNILSAFSPLPTSVLREPWAVDLKKVG